MKCELEDVYFSDEFVEIMEQLECRSLVIKNNVKEVTVELSKQELYKKPYLIDSCWKFLFYPLRTKFPNPDDLPSLYQTLEPTDKKVISCVIASPQNEAENFYLLSGAGILVVEAINLTFKKNKSKFIRRPIRHTCV